MVEVLETTRQRVALRTLTSPGQRLFPDPLTYFLIYLLSNLLTKWSKECPEPVGDTRKSGRRYGRVSLETFVCVD